MERALVVLDQNGQGRRLLEEAAELAVGVDAKLHVLTLLTPEEFGEKRDALDAVERGEQTSYDEGVVLDRARQDAEEVVAETVGDLDLDYEVVPGRVGEAEAEADRILDTAEERDVDHVFIAGRKRSPTGKAVFGDRAQSIVLNFDGAVTSLLE